MELKAVVNIYKCGQVTLTTPIWGLCSEQIFLYFHFRLGTYVAPAISFFRAILVILAFLDMVEATSTYESRPIPALSARRQVQRNALAPPEFWLQKLVRSVNFGFVFKKFHLGLTQNKIYNFYVTEFNITVQLSVEVLFHNTIPPKRLPPISLSPCYSLPSPPLFRREAAFFNPTRGSGDRCKVNSVFSVFIFTGRQHSSAFFNPATPRGLGSAVR